MNLYQHGKNTVSSIFSEEIVDLEIQQHDWLRAFSPIFQEKDFFQYMICAETQNPEKINEQISP